MLTIVGASPLEDTSVVFTPAHEPVVGGTYVNKPYYDQVIDVQYPDRTLRHTNIQVNNASLGDVTVLTPEVCTLVGNQLVMNADTLAQHHTCSISVPGDYGTKTYHIPAIAAAWQPIVTVKDHAAGSLMKTLWDQQSGLLNTHLAEVTPWDNDAASNILRVFETKHASGSAQTGTINPNNILLEIGYTEAELLALAKHEFWVNDHYRLVPGGNAHDITISEADYLSGNVMYATGDSRLIYGTKPPGALVPVFLGSDYTEWTPRFSHDPTTYWENYVQFVSTSSNILGSLFPLWRIKTNTPAGSADSYWIEPVCGRLANSVQVAEGANAYAEAPIKYISEVLFKGKDLPLTEAVWAFAQRATDCTAGDSHGPVFTKINGRILLFTTITYGGCLHGGIYIGSGDNKQSPYHPSLKNLYAWADGIVVANPGPYLNPRPLDWGFPDRDDAAAWRARGSRWPTLEEIMQKMAALRGDPATYTVDTVNFTGFTHYG